MDNWNKNEMSHYKLYERRRIKPPPSPSNIARNSKCQCAIELQYIHLAKPTKRKIFIYYIYNRATTTNRLHPVHFHASYHTKWVWYSSRRKVSKNGRLSNHTLYRRHICSISLSASTRYIPCDVLSLPTRMWGKEAVGIMPKVELKKERKKQKESKIRYTRRRCKDFAI